MELNPLQNWLWKAACSMRGEIDADRRLVRFYLPAHVRWIELRGHTTGLGARLTDNLRAIASENPKLVGVIDRRDFNATDQGQRVLEEDTLARLIAILSEQRLGRAYEYLIRKFAERGSSAGEFFTPTEVGFLIAYMDADVRQGNIMRNPLFVNEDGSLRRFHKIAASPMWNQEVPAAIYENDSDGHFACYRTQGCQGNNRSA